MKTHTSAIQFDLKAKELTKEYLRSESQLVSLLIEMKNSSAFVALGYSGVYDYCYRALKFSEAQSSYFKSVIDASLKAPKLKAALENGELTVSMARRIAPVIDGGNQTHWIDMVKTLPQKELEREVSAANPNAIKPREKIKPVGRTESHISAVVTIETEEKMKKLQDLLSQKLGRHATLGEVLDWAVKTTEEKFSPEEKALRSAKRKVTRVNSKPQASSGRTPIPSSIRHEIVRRDNYQCGFISSHGVRCTSRRFLHIHHQKEVSRGGTNTADNLTFRCSTHHRFIHGPYVLPRQNGRLTSR